MDQLMQSSYSAAINLARRASSIKREQDPDEAQEAQPDVRFVDVDSDRVEPFDLPQMSGQDVDPLMLPRTFQTLNTVSQDLPSLPGPHHFKQEMPDSLKQEPPEMQYCLPNSHGTLQADQDVDPLQLSSLPESRCLKPPRLHSCVVDASEICSAELQNDQGSKSSVHEHKSAECDVVGATPCHLVDQGKNESTKHTWTRDERENGPSLGNQEQESHACDSMFSGNDALVEHKRIHCDASDARPTRVPYKRFSSGEKPFACDTCEARFSQSCDLNRHMRCHSGDKPYACDVCEAKFAQSSHLTTHMRSHSGARPYACDMCAARFTQGSNLTRHKLSHSGDKPHGCDMCQARFARLSHLREHKKFHSGDKPFFCELCTARYTQKYYLTRHMKSHMEQKTYACDKCEARFAQNSNLTRHKRCHLGDTNYVCHICQARFARSSHLTRHKKSHFSHIKSHS